MKFDLFDALAILKKEFGNDCRLTLYNEGSDIAIRLTVIPPEQPSCNTQFMVTSQEIISDDYICVTSRKFHRAIKELREFMDNLDIDK